MNRQKRFPVNEVNIIEALKQTEASLRQVGLPEAVLESRLLIQRTLGIDQIALYLQKERLLTSGEMFTLETMVKRRVRGEPFFYIIGEREFYGLNFYVNHDVLIPRPETELLVGKTINLARTNKFTVMADIGTGSGNIAVCLALNIPDTKIYAVDISLTALKVARLNCCKHGVAAQVKLLQGDLLQPLPEKCDCIIANLPYVKIQDINGALAYEPALALDGGQDGLEQIIRLLKMLKDKLNGGGYLLLEIGLGQAQNISEMVETLYPQADIEALPDYAGIERVLVVNIPDV